MISTKNIVENSMASEIGGYKKVIRAGKGKNIKLNEKVMKDIENSKISLDEYIALQEFAQYLPRGHRKLKLNIPELRDELLSSKNLNPLTDRQGLRSGGKASMTNGGKVDPKKSSKIIKEASQADLLFTIKNKNRLKSRVNADRSFNPNYTSFKNNFKIS